MDELAAFLTARLNEDEAVAKAADPGPWEVGERGGQDSMVWIREKDSPGVDNVGITYRKPVFTAQTSNQLRFRENARHIARHDPARVLREVEAKRAILRRCTVRMNEPDQWPNGLVSPRALLARQILMDLAAAWSDHPDHDPEWQF